MRRRAAAAVVFLAAALFSPAGCGYEAGWLRHDGDRTIAIDVIANDTFRREIEFFLTTRLHDEVQSRSGLRIASRDEADILMTGRIVDVRERVVSETQEDDVFESNVTVWVTFRVVDRRTGTLRKEFALADTGRFLPGTGQDSDTGTREAFASLARRAIEQLERSF